MIVRRRAFPMCRICETGELDAEEEQLFRLRARYECLCRRLEGLPPDGGAAAELRVELQGVVTRAMGVATFLRAHLSEWMCPAARHLDEWTRLETYFGD